MAIKVKRTIVIGKVEACFVQSMSSWLKGISTYLSCTFCRLNVPMSNSEKSNLSFYCIGAAFKLCSLLFFVSKKEKLLF